MLGNISFFVRRKIWFVFKDEYIPKREKVLKLLILLLLMAREEDIINLDESVVNALRLFEENKMPALNFSFYKKPIVLGSGNAAVTGKILFNDSDAVFADESNYIKKLDTIEGIDGAVLISASGGKHAPIIAKELKKRNIPCFLLTCNENAEAKKYIDRDKVFVFRKNPEPYTYNTSTYLGMVLAKTGENAKEIHEFIKEKVDFLIPSNLKKYDAYFFVVPEDFDNVKEMFSTKFDELFGGRIKGRCFTPEQTKHAKTVVPYENELFVSFGYENKDYGEKENRVNIPLPENASYAAIIAIGYYVIGKIQEKHEPYFKENIEKYVKFASKVWGEKIRVIAE